MRPLDGGWYVAVGTVPFCQGRLGVLRGTVVGTFAAAYYKANLARGRSGHVVVARNAGSSDPIDASVVRDASGVSSVIPTSDPNDIRRPLRALPRDLAPRIVAVRA